MTLEEMMDTLIRKYGFEDKRVIYFCTKVEDFKEKRNKHYTIKEYDLKLLFCLLIKQAAEALNL